MARRQSMRIGSLNILVLIIAISLAVLSVLAFVTARADANLAARHAEVTQESYDEERAGQYFVACVDGSLSEMGSDYLEGLGADSVQLESRVSVYMRENGIDGIACSVNVLEPEGLREKLTAGATIDGAGSGDTAATTIADGVAAETASDDSASISALPEQSIYHLEVLNDAMQDCVGGIEATFTSASNQMLECMLAVYSDGTYRILSWNSMKVWPEDAQGETLFRQ